MAAGCRTYDIVVVGGGFAGFWAAIAARRVLGGTASIALLAPTNRLVIRPRLYQAKPEAMHVDLRPYLQSIGIDFVQAEADELDVARGCLRTAKDQVGFRRLVIATGSRIRIPNVPGVHHAHTIDDQPAAIALDHRLRRLALSGGTPGIAVVGAGFTGIEIALELRDRLAGHGGRDVADGSSIFLVDPGLVVGHTLGDNVRPVILTALEQARVKLVLGRRVSRITETDLQLGDGTTIRSDATILTTGMAAHPFVLQVPGDHDLTGRAIVDRYLRSPAAHSVFVAGDAAVADTGDGATSLQSCQHALQMGRFAGENAARDLLGQPMIAYTQPGYVTCLDLGRAGAVFMTGRDRVVQLTGAAAKARKRHINEVFIYPPALGAPDALLRQSRIEE